MSGCDVPVSIRGVSQAEWATLFLQLGVMLGGGLLLGGLAARLRLQALFGELVAGILLGPTLLGAVAPAAERRLFPSAGPVHVASAAIVALGMLLFLFSAGLEVDLGHVAPRLRAITWTSACGIAVPMATGAASVWLFPGLWGAGDGGRAGLLALTVGTALSISALPVIARILTDLDLLADELGVVVMSAATLDDLVGWALFAVILGDLEGVASDAGSPVTTVARALAFVAVTVAVGRLVGRPALAWLRLRLPWPTGFLAATAVVVLLAASAAELIGLHAIFGAFFAGVALARRDESGNEAHATIQRFVLGFFAPLYFVSLGLQAHFSRDFDVRLVALVTVVACAGKLGGAWVGGRLGGLPTRSAVAVAFGLNARGAMEMVIASVALHAGLIEPRVFVALIVMALMTSLISGPAIGALMRTRTRPVRDAAA